MAFVVALYGARNGASAIIIGLDIAYEEKETRGFFELLALSLAITIGGILIAVLAMVAVASPGHLDDMLGGAPALVVVLGKLFSYSGLILGGAGGAATLYRYGPDRRRAKWVWITPGSMIAAQRIDGGQMPRRAVLGDSFRLLAQPHEKRPIAEVEFARARQFSEHDPDHAIYRPAMPFERWLAEESRGECGVADGAPILVETGHQQAVIAGACLWPHVSSCAEVEQDEPPGLGFANDNWRSSDRSASRPTRTARAGQERRAARPRRPAPLASGLSDFRSVGPRRTSSPGHSLC